MRQRVIEGQDVVRIKRVLPLYKVHAFKAAQGLRYFNPPFVVGQLRAQHERIPHLFDGDFVRVKPKCFGQAHGLAAASGEHFGGGQGLAGNGGGGHGVAFCI